MKTFILLLSLLPLSALAIVGREESEHMLIEDGRKMKLTYRYPEQKETTTRLLPDILLNPFPETSPLKFKKTIKCFDKERFRWVTEEQKYLAEQKCYIELIEDRDCDEPRVILIDYAIHRYEKKNGKKLKPFLDKGSVSIITTGLRKKEKPEQVKPE